MFLSFAALSCDAAQGPNPADRLPAPATYTEPAATDGETRQAVFAGGCFWCVEGVYEQLAGVIDAESGYAGGSAETADYDSVCRGTTNHAEVVRVTYDPSVVDFGQLMQVFFATHDPTTLNRQGPDVGTQYRSAIFYSDEGQRAAAAAYIAELNASGRFSNPIVTTLEALEAYFPAEGYHQDFVQRNPDHGYIRQQALPKIQKLKKLYPESLRSAAPKPDADK